VIGFLKGLFKIKPPVLSSDLQALQAQAESAVRGYLGDGKPFPMFAMAMQANGEIVSMLPSEEIPDSREAFAAVVGRLMGLVRDHAIRASVLVTPWEDGGAHTAVFDLEQRDGGRVLVLLPYRMGPGGVRFEPATTQHAVPKLFA
jgi:hypothetical protein